MVSENPYPVTKLVQIPSKGDMFFVQVTKPKDVFAISGGNKTVRKSTGTKDKRLAEKLWRSIEQEIYREWDNLLKRDRFIELLEAHWKPQKAMGLRPAEFIETWDGGRVLACQLVCITPTESDMELANELFQFLTYHEALEFRSILTPPADPYPVAIQNEKLAAGRAYDDKLYGPEANTSQRRKTTPNRAARAFVNRTGCPTVLEALPGYLADRKWDNRSAKERHYAGSYIEKCTHIIGDKPLDQIIPKDAKAIMEALDEEGLANSTIKTYKRHLSEMLSWAVVELVNEHSSPKKPFLSQNPFHGIGARDYGTTKRSYEALTEDQLHRLFALPMPDEHRLLLSILVTTGMRLDEAALLQWSQFKTDRNGLRYFDLSDAKVKNAYSARTVALPDCLQLPPLGTGRIFSFKVEADGKSSKAASRALRPYFLQIRYDENDNRKVAHSLRHNLIGWMANLTDPVPPSEHMDWITGHGMEDSVKQSERTKTYGKDIDVRLKYDIVNRIKHPWLNFT